LTPSEYFAASAAIGFMCVCAAAIPSVAEAQTASPLDEIVVTAKSLEENLPQQLSQYGTPLDTISAA
jgi:hypothetical protein